MNLRGAGKIHLKWSKSCFQQVPSPWLLPPHLGPPRGGFHCIITHTVLLGSLSPVSLNFVGEKVEGVFPGLRTHAGLAGMPFFLHVT